MRCDVKQKITFPEPSCRYDCPHFKATGSVLNETCYCMKAGGKNGKRFRSKDLKRRPPEWCPRRLSPPVCRIYGFKDEFQERMERDTWYSIDPKKQDWYFPLAFRYQFRCEIPLGMSASSFYAAVQEEVVEEVLGGTPLKNGELIEIDDGLTSHFFYCYNSMTVIPAKVFGLDKPGKAGRHD
ncbi:Uncharacterised protein [uncultured Flavonifractor sp.]|nr:Uncharacterised protein [Flavonifractor plautii]SCJ23619.1 Uncharacterised protein [uncultured Flavonifractor sp.]